MAVVRVFKEGRRHKFGVWMAKSATAEKPFKPQECYPCMKRAFFKTIVRINNILLPKLSGKDPSKLNKAQQAMLAYRYWALINSL